MAASVFEVSFISLAARRFSWMVLAAASLAVKIVKSWVSAEIPSAARTSYSSLVRDSMLPSSLGIKICSPSQSKAQETRPPTWRRSRAHAGERVRRKANASCRIGLYIVTRKASESRENSGARSMVCATRSLK